MNEQIMKKILFIALLTAFTFSINGMDDPISPPRPPRAAVVANVVPDLTQPQISSIAKLMGMCFEQIQNVHALFSTDPSTDPSMDDAKPIIAVAGIRDIFTELTPLFLERLDSKKGKHITPECRKALGTHLRDIAGDDPKDFLKKGDPDFSKSVNPKDFYTIVTHFGNTFFIPKWQKEPYFTFWRKSTSTLKGIEYGLYNALKLLKGENTESHSGVLEHHHVYQNQGTVTPVCWSEHKGQTKRYHKSESESGIDRKICGTEFYFINKLIGLLQVASMCERILTTVDDDQLTEGTLSIMKKLRNYTGNITIIPNESAAIRKRLRLEIPEAFAQAGQAASSSLSSSSQPSFGDKVVGTASSSPPSSASSQLSQKRGSSQDADYGDENPPRVKRTNVLGTKKKTALLPIGVNSSSSVATFS